LEDIEILTPLFGNCLKRRLEKSSFFVKKGHFLEKSTDFSGIVYTQHKTAQELERKFYKKSMNRVTPANISKRGDI
jgi:hypothetical protein